MDQMKLKLGVNVLMFQNLQAKWKHTQNLRTKYGIKFLTFLVIFSRFDISSDSFTF